MKILLAEAPFSYDDATFKGERYFPLGIGYLASYLRQSGKHEISIFVDSIHEFGQHVASFKPDIVGLSSMTSSYPACAEMAKISKERCPNCIIIVGGQHATSVGQQIFTEVPQVDFIGMGEGELLFDSFVGQIENGTKNWSLVPGLIYKDSGKIRSNPIAETIMDLDRLPFPARDLLPLDKFSSHGHMKFGKYTASLITSRGCPALCTYCSSFVTMGRKYRARSAENVVAEIEELYCKGVKSFIFWDDMFTFDQRRVIRFCDLIGQKKIRIKWWCMSRADFITEDLATRMKRAGCIMISFGLESGSEETLKKIKKKIHLDQARKAIYTCAKAGIRTQGSFIVGLPFETMEDIQKTIDFSKSTSLHMALFFSFTPFPGVEEWQHVSPEMIPKNPYDWKAFACNTKTSKSWNHRLTDKELAELVLRCHREFYLRPRQVLRILFSMTSWAELISYFSSAINFFVAVLDKSFLPSQRK